MDNKLESISYLFEDNEIRSIWDSEKYDFLFSVIDVINALITFILIYGMLMVKYYIDIFDCYDK